MYHLRLNSYLKSTCKFFLIRINYFLLQFLHIDNQFLKIVGLQLNIKFLIHLKELILLSQVEMKEKIEPVS